MPRKGMRSICFRPKTSSFSLARRSNPASPSTPTHRFASCEATVDQIIDSAAETIMKWNPDGSTYARVTSLFYESRCEAALFIRCVADLQKAMHFLISEDSTSPRLVQAHGLTEVAMKRLQKELYQILSTNRAHLDPESMSSRASARSSTSTYSDYEDAGSEDDARAAGDLISEVERESSGAMEDLKSIAECMIASGYALECLRVYKIIRKSIIDEGIYRLGVERISASQLGKMDWEVIELKIKSWCEAVKIAMKTLFTGERILCDHVFSSSDSIRASCFAEISREGATILFGFPEVVAKRKKSPEKIFRLLDMYSVISQHWPEIESIFSHESTSAIRSQALTSLHLLGDSVRAMLADFESAIQRESAKSSVPGGGVHGLTRGVMDFLTLLSDYDNAITGIFFDSPPPGKSSPARSDLEISDSVNEPAPAVSVRIAWLILVLMCKLDGKAEHYRDVSMSYLFLANNLQHVLNRVRSSNLQYILGEDWISKQEEKVRRFAANYERLGWGQVLASLPENPTSEMSTEEAKDWFKKFNSSFEQAFRKQSSCVVPDQNLRDEIKASVARKLVSVYREFCETRHVAKDNEVGSGARYSPEDVANYLSDLFLDTAESGSGLSSASSFPAASLGQRSQSPWEILRNHLMSR